jgi:hypothetical protein
MPSWKMEVLSPASLPGTRPPTSEWWVTEAAKATGRPSTKMGVASVQSLRCVTPTI